MRSAVIVVAYKNSPKELAGLKKQIVSIGYRPSAIFIVDNSLKNRGFAGGINLALRRAIGRGFDHFIVLNPDIDLRPIGKKDIEAVLRRFDVAGFAMQQNKTIYYGGEIDRWRLSGGLVSKKPKERYAPCDFVSGSFLAFSKKVIDAVGFFDESYFMYYEDVDFCRRSRQAGLRVGIDAKIVYDHWEVSQANASKSRLLARNRLKFFLRHSNRRQKIYEVLRLPKTLLEARSRYFTNFVSLNISSVVVKTANFVLFLFLIRFLSPSAFGLYSVVWAQVNILSPLLDWGTTAYGLVYLTRDKKKLSSLISLRFFLALVVFFLTMITVTVWHFKPGLIVYILLLSFIFFANAASGSYLILNSITERLYRSSWLSAVFNLASTALVIGVLLFSSNLQSVFGAFAVSYILYTLINVFLMFRENKPAFPPLRKVLPDWFKIVKKSYIFVVIGVFAGLYYRADVFLLHALKGDRAVGIYSAGYKFLDALMFIVASYNLTATPVFVRLAKSDPGSLKKRLKKDLVFLTVGGWAVAVVGSRFAPVLSLILKGEYLLAIPVIKIVLFALPFILVTSLFLNAIYALKKAGLVIWIFVGQAVINISLNLLLIPRYSYLASAWITVVSEMLNTFMAFSLFFLIFRRSTKPTKP
ncbi:oligosaccharide flippase family protein [Candidatus Roizmanbacteria bacterium]|nr:oligosaccharide flippase family protein [Candidatus Roizmanbacteria bacterium]